MTKRKDRIILAIGIAAVIVATWFASLKPTPPPLPDSIAGAATSSGTAGGYSQTTDAPATADAGTKSDPLAPVRITVMAPVAGSKLVIGQNYTISWDKAAGVGGEIYLVNADTGATAGWVQHSLDPKQTQYPWNVQSVFQKSSVSLSQDVVPGSYILEIAFDSTGIPNAKSGVFSIVSATTTE